MAIFHLSVLPPTVPEKTSWDELLYISFMSVTVAFLDQLTNSVQEPNETLVM